MDFEIIIQECFLGDPLLKLLKEFRYVEQNGCFGSLVILDVARCYLWLFTLYINIKIGKNSC